VDLDIAGLRDGPVRAILSPRQTRHGDSRLTLPLPHATRQPLLSGSVGLVGSLSRLHSDADVERWCVRASWGSIQCALQAKLVPPPWTTSPHRTPIYRTVERIDSGQKRVPAQQSQSCLRQRGIGSLHLSHSRSHWSCGSDRNPNGRRRRPSGHGGSGRRPASCRRLERDPTEGRRPPQKASAPLNNCIDLGGNSRA